MKIDKKTNADEIRSATDEQLVEIIGRLMGNAAACPDCFRKNGIERLRLWLSLEGKQ